MERQNHFENENAMPPPVQLLDIATGFWKTQAIYVAAKIGIADLLKDGSKNIDELSSATGVHSRSLYRLLRALASIGIFIENDDGSFGLTSLATTLQSDNPMSVRSLAVLVGEQFWWDPWGNLEHSVMTGEAAFERVFGIRIFEYFGKHPEIGHSFNKWMTRLSELTVPALLESYDFSTFHKVVDIGGGHGSLLVNILKANPKIKGVLFDLPDVVKAANEIDADIIERCEIIGGDFFELVPAGGDAYILKQIIHDWDDDLSVKILKNCHKAMADNGRVLVIDAVIQPGNAPDLNKFIDLNMLILTHGGRERTEFEFRSLFEAAGFELTNIFSTPSLFSIIEGIRK